MRESGRQMAKPFSNSATGETIEDFFVCVGARKAGTTWLGRMLAAHPEIFVTPVKEIHYFDHVQGLTDRLAPDRFRSRYRKYFQRMLTQPHRLPHHLSHWAWYRAYMTQGRDDDWYRSLFRHRGGARLAGELTPDYAIIGTEGFRHLARLAPRVRILYVLRNPVTQNWSQLLHYCRQTRQEISELSAKALMSLVESEELSRFSAYERTLDDLFQVFPSKQVYVAFYEDIHADRPRALEEICAFLGVGFDPNWFPHTGQRVNRAQTAPPLPDDLREHLRHLYRPVAQQVENRLGRLPESWRREFGL